MSWNFDAMYVSGTKLIRYPVLDWRAMDPNLDKVVIGAICEDLPTLWTYLRANQTFWSIFQDNRENGYLCQGSRLKLLEPAAMRKQLMTSTVTVDWIVEIWAQMLEELEEAHRRGYQIAYTLW